MKRHLLFFLIAIFIGIYSLAQDTVRPHKKIYKITLLSKLPQPFSNAYLVTVDDSAVYLSPNPVVFNAGNSANLNFTRVAYPDIERIEVKRKGSVGRGALRGGIIGVSAGMIAGFAAGDDPPCTNDFWGICSAFRSTAGEKALGLGLAGGVMGSLIGVLVGALTHKTFIINGNRQKLADMKYHLMP